ncbi:hypothetical protein [Halarcobacter bivalviorum]|uniref:Distal flagellar hook-filament junction protein n=1 Tax=Halarcobacter bivalviorum TaxID=663364 RepID=A0AAX2A728_9BACT|nr:hypothetical protein [Halarcobacter bivalviorum]AXH11501.1 distal flagellar hook-filament junction protein [Halarcobacter bivalviorum]RXK09316.1 hypothetical protein CRV05_10315 [Halarcobacter bivalviorum]
MIRSTSETLFRLENLNKEQLRISYQISSTKKLQYGSDDANLFTRDIYLDDKLKVYEGIKLQIEKTTAQNNVSDSTLAEVKNLLTYVKQELIKANNGTTSQDAREAIAVNLKGVKENLYMLSNEQVEGEYIYAGSDSMVKPFVQDASGKITYQGDSFLRKTAVEDGSYREKGVTGFETFLYTASFGLKGETLEFEKTDRIIDQGSFEWKIEAVVPSTTATSPSSVLSFDANEPLMDENGVEWRLNAGGTAVENAAGDSIAVTGTGPYSIDMAAITITPATATAPTELSKVQIVKYDEEGTRTNEVLAVKAGANKDYEVVLPNVDGTKFEAKGNTFDVLDKIINALELKDATGNTITKDEADAELAEALDMISLSFDTANTGHAKLGGRNKVFEISLERVTSKITQFSIMSHEVGAADLTKLAVEAKALEVTYTALYSTINKMNQLSLVNFVR